MSAVPVSKARNKRDSRTRSRTMKEDEKGIVPAIAGGISTQLRLGTVQSDAKGSDDDQKL